MSVRIVTDSTCDLPEATIKEYGIRVIPLYINIGQKGYLDGIEITREEYYRRLPDYETIPTTAIPSPVKFRQSYEDLAAQGASSILSIHISVSLSATVDAARIGAQDFTAVPVTVFDSRQLTLGMGYLIETAAKAAQEGAEVADILALMNEQISRTHVFAALDTLDYLRRSGRMNWAVAELGNLLRIKPLLRMYEGNPTTERVRTTKRANERLLKILSDLAPLERVAIVHTHATARAELLRQEAQHLLPPGETPSVDITPVIGTHLGTGTAGFACIMSRKA
jgi:DegV family protein with EDD domain